jgi:hypothetical protein
VYAEAGAGYNLAPCGDVAQLGERRVRNAEVVSSILIVSTIVFLTCYFGRFFFAQCRSFGPVYPIGVPKATTMGYRSWSYLHKNRHGTLCFRWRPPLDVARLTIAHDERQEARPTKVIS